LISGQIWAASGIADLAAGVFVAGWVSVGVSVGVLVGGFGVNDCVGLCVAACVAADCALLVGENVALILVALIIVVSVMSDSNTDAGSALLGLDDRLVVVLPGGLLFGGAKPAASTGRCSPVVKCSAVSASTTAADDGKMGVANQSESTTAERVGFKRAIASKNSAVTQSETKRPSR
jgi:hypothetical protein